MTQLYWPLQGLQHQRWYEHVDGALQIHHSRRLRHMVLKTETQLRFWKVQQYTNKTPHTIPAGTVSSSLDTTLNMKFLWKYLVKISIQQYKNGEDCKF